MEELIEKTEPEFEYVQYITTDGTYDYSSHTKGCDAFRQLTFMNVPNLEVKVVSVQHEMRIREENNGDSKLAG